MRAPWFGWCGALLLAVQVHAAPRIGPPMRTDAPVLGPAYGAQTDPALSFGADQMFVVWTDVRASGPSIFGARLAPGTTLVDQTGLQLYSAAGNRSHPAIAFDGTNYLVVWEEVDASNNVDLLGLRVAPDGTVRDAVPFIVSNATGDQRFPALAFNGLNYIVVWQDTRASANADIYAARVSPAGMVLDNVGVALATGAAIEASPAIACGGLQCVVVWVDSASGQPAVVGVRLSSVATSLEANPLPISADPFPLQYPSIASSGEQFFVAWASNTDIRGARFSTDAGVLDNVGLEVATFTGTCLGTSVAFSGGAYGVSWSETTAIRVRSFDTNGASIGSSPTVVATGTALSRPQSSGTTGRAIAVWSADDPVTSGDVFGAVLSDVPDAGLLSMCANGQLEATLSTVGSSSFLAWVDLRNGKTAVLGEHLAADGTPLESSPMVLSPSLLTQRAPSVAHGGGLDLVVWVEGAGTNSSLRAVRVSPSGPVDLTSLVLSSGQQEAGPHVTFVGTQWLVAWTDHRTGNLGVFMTRVALDGQVSNPGGVQVAAGIAAGSSIVPAPGGALVSWYRALPPGRVVSQRINPDGSPLDASPFTLGFVSGVSAISGAFDGVGNLTAWYDEGRALHVSPVPPPGTVSVISTTATDRPLAWPALAFDGTRYVLVWEDVSSSLTGALLGTDGNVLERFPVAARGGEQSPVLALTTGRGVFANSRFDLTPGIGASRVEFRTVGNVDAGSPCDVDAQCLSGACALGVCCSDARCSAADGGVDGGLRFLSSPPGPATCGHPWKYLPVIEPNAGVVFSLVTQSGAPLPSEVVFDANSGAVTAKATVTPLSLAASANQQTATQALSPEVKCDPGRLQLGCTCDEAPAGVWAAVGALLLRRRLRARRGSG